MKVIDNILSPKDFKTISDEILGSKPLTRIETQTWQSPNYQTDQR